MTRTRALIISVGAVVVALIGAAVLSVPRSGTESDGETVDDRNLSEDCDIGVPDAAFVPEGWRPVLGSTRCLSYAAPPYAERAEADGADGVFVSIVHRGAADDGSDLQSVVVDDGLSAFGCHAPPDLYPPDCLDADAVRERYNRLEHARAADVYLGPEVRGACEGMDAPCVVQEAHLFTENGKWLTVLTFMGEAVYDGGGAQDFLDIVRSMDAR